MEHKPGIVQQVESVEHKPGIVQQVELEEHTVLEWLQARPGGASRET